MNTIYKYKYLILAIIIGIVAFGVYYTIQIPKQEMPTLQTPYLIITASKNQESETSLDNSLSKWIDHEDISSIKTITYPISTLIIIELSYDTPDPDQLKLSIVSDLKESLPNYTLTEKEVIASYDLIFAVSGNTSTLNTVGNELVEAIALLPTTNTSINMEYSEYIDITFSPEKMLIHNISTQDLDAIIQEIQSKELQSMNELMSSKINTSTVLEDIAEVSIISTPDASYNNEPTIFVQSSFKEGIDYTRYINDIEEIVDNLNQKYSSNTVTPIVQTPKDVDILFSDLIESILLAVIVVFIVALIGLGFKQSIIVVSIVPATIFITILALYFLGFELHKLTIIGLILSIGMMVDNAIVLTEGTKSNIELGYTSKEAATLAIKKNKWPILTATLTTLIAFSSIVFIPGFVGDLIKSMPISVIIAISSSYCLSLILTPILASMFIKTGKTSSNNSLFFETVLDRTFRFSKSILILVVFLVASILFLSLRKTDVNLFPSDEKNDFYISVTSVNEADLTSSVNTLYENLYAVDDILGITVSLNQDIPRFHLSSKALSYDQYSARIYINYSGSHTDMLSLIDTVNSWEIGPVSFSASAMYLAPPDAPLEVIITGDNASKEALIIYENLADSDLIESIQITSNQTIQYPVVYPLAERSELEVMFMNQLVQKNIQNTVIIDNKTLNLNYGLDITDNLYLLSLDNTAYFYENYRVELSAVDYSIHQYNLENSAYFSITPFENKDITAIRDLIDEQLPSTLTASYSGENNLFLTLSKSLIVSASIAILLMFLLLWFQFKKLSYPLIIMVTVPLSFTGSLLGMKLFGYDITISSLIGMVSLLGVTINIGILLIEEIVSKMQYHTLKDACIRGTANRLRPILLTSSTTILGLIPLYINGGDFFKPLAITFIFGMIFATIVSLFIIPIMVYLTQIKKHINVT